MIAISREETPRDRAWSNSGSPHPVQSRPGENGLDSSELSAVQALLSLTPSSRPSVDLPENRSFVPLMPDPHSPSSQPRPLSKIKLTPLNPMQMPRVIVPSCDSASSLSGDSVDDSQSQSDWSVSSQQSNNFFCGSTSLALDTDEDFLSPLHCFMRRYCVEAFTATSQDATEPRQGLSQTRLTKTSYRVMEGQVGIRCIHCKHRSVRRERAVCFPSSLKNVYHSIETWQRRHSLVCQDIPPWVKASMTELVQNSRSGAGGRRQYWEESARRVGLADTPHGVRFIRPPGDQGQQRDDVSMTCVEIPSTPVVRPEDSELVTSYLFLLLDQMETCRFSEEDRAGGRSKVKDCPVGYPGMQCKHCGGKAGFGRYFPATLVALTSANSDRNIFNHVQKCRRCPRAVQETLVRLRDEHNQLKNRRGSRKLFFERLWNRLHCAEK